MGFLPHHSLMVPKLEVTIVSTIIRILFILAALVSASALLLPQCTDAEDITFTDSIASDETKWYQIDVEDPRSIEVTLDKLDHWGEAGLEGLSVGPGGRITDWEDDDFYGFDDYDNDLEFHWNYLYYQEVGDHYLLLRMSDAGGDREFNYYGHSNIDLIDFEPEHGSHTILRNQYLWFDIDVTSTDNPIVIAFAPSIDPVYLWIDLFDPSDQVVYKNRTNAKGFTVISIRPETTGTYSLRLGAGILSDASLECDVTSNLALTSRPGEGSDAVAVTSPNETSVWAVGEDHDIEWLTAGDPGDTVSIELVITGPQGHVLTIASSAPNNGVYKWRVPEDIEPSTSYRIILSTTTVKDGTWYFVIVPGTIEVLPPSQTVWRSREEYTIRWKSHGEIGDSVNIELWRNTWSVRSDYPVAWDIPNSGSYRWRVPAHLTPGTYNLEVSSYEYRSITGEVEGITIEFAGVPDGHEASGTLGPRGGEWYKLEVKRKDKPVDVTLSFDREVEMSMVLYDAMGHEVADDWDVNETISVLYHEQLGKGTYLLHITNYDYGLTTNYTMTCNRSLKRMEVDTETRKVRLEGNETVYYEVDIGNDLGFMFLNITWPYDAAAWQWRGSVMQPRGIEVSIYGPAGDRIGFSRYARDDNIRFVRPLDVPGVYTVVLKGFDRWDEPLNVTMECNRPLERLGWTQKGSLEYGETREHAFKVTDVDRPILISWETSESPERVLELRVLGPEGNVMETDDEGRRNTLAVVPSVEGVYRVQVIWTQEPSVREIEYVIVHNQGDEVDAEGSTGVSGWVVIAIMAIAYVLVMGAWIKQRRGKRSGREDEE